MRRREFITLLGGATTVTSLSWPLAARAQQVGTRRIGVLMGFPEADPAARALLAEFIGALAEHGWTDGGNVRIDVRWASGTIDQMRVFARELVDLKPDVILSNTTVATAALKYETQTIPIVFVVVADPIGSGFVASLPRPGGQITGFSPLEASIPGKWLELLKEIAPGLKRVAMVFNPDTAPFVTSFFQPPFEAAAQSLGLATRVAPVHSEAELETVITALGRERLLRATRCPRSIRRLSAPGMAACCPMARTSRTYFGVPPAMWTTFCAAPSRPSYPSRCRSSIC